MSPAGSLEKLGKWEGQGDGVRQALSAPGQQSSHGHVATAPENNLLWAWHCRCDKPSPIQDKPGPVRETLKSQRKVVMATDSVSLPFPLPRLSRASSSTSVSLFLYRSLNLCHSLCSVSSFPSECLLNRLSVCPSHSSFLSSFPQYQAAGEAPAYQTPTEHIF